MRTNEGLPNPLPPTTIWRKYPRRQCKGLIEAIRHDSNIVIEELELVTPIGNMEQYVMRTEMETRYLNT